MVIYCPCTVITNEYLEIDISTIQNSMQYVVVQM